jgi:uridine kinase
MNTATIIGIAGGTASGKTTIARRIFEATSKKGSVVVIKMDDYYKGKGFVPQLESGAWNFDHPDSYDSKLLIEQLKRLKNGHSIEKPTYDFVTSSRKQETETIEPVDVIIVEGIMALAIPDLRDCFDIKIFVDSPDDIRFIRRLKRDVIERGRTIESIINQYMATVRPMHEAFVEPSKKNADIIIPEGGKNDVAIDVLVNKIDNLFTN